MPKCKKSEGQAIDYASKLLSTAEEKAFEQHLKGCSDCNQAVESFSKVLNLTDMAEKEVALPEVALRDIEMNVYKRLAATQEESWSSRIRAFFANFQVLFQWHKTAAASTLAIALITAVVLFAEFFQPEVGLQLTETQSADAARPRPKLGAAQSSPTLQKPTPRQRDSALPGHLCLRESQT